MTLSLWAAIFRSNAFDLQMYLTGNFDECVRNDTDETVGCVSFISVMPGIWASVYALPLLSFSGNGGILYGGLSMVFFNADFNDNLVNAAVKYDDWLSNGRPVFTGAIGSQPAEMEFNDIVHDRLSILSFTSMQNVLFMD